jgi:DNA-binding transcriptional MerR regulator
MRLKVGEFSRLCQAPVKTLRYYDEIGLFTPAEIDRFTGYRYYTLEQLPHIHRIMALKELGLSLDQIALLVNENLSLDEIRAMLLRQQQEVQQRIDEEMERLALVRFHLRQIENEAKLPNLQIVIRALQPFPALTLRGVFPGQRDIDQTGLAIMQAYARGDLKTVAVPLGIAYVEEFRREDLDYEFVLPVEDTRVKAVSLGENGTLTLREVAALPTAATYVHQGDYDGLTDASVALQRWAVANGYRLGREMRMVYFRGPMHRVPPAEYLTELQHQIDKVE